MSKLTADIDGIIREIGLKEKDIMVPIFECVVNAIQAIEEASNSRKGCISIEIIRDKSQLTLFEECQNFPISSIIVTDNGIGFTKSNISSFQEVYSSKKLSIGGKGIGRFAMLSMYSSIDIESIVSSADGNQKHNIRLDRANGIEKTEVQPSNKEAKTTVRLNELLPSFSKVSAKYNHEKIANLILGHCLLYFLSDTAPDITVIENNEVICLKNLFSKTDLSLFPKVIRTLKGSVFTFYFIKNQNKYNSFAYCANNRKVSAKKLQSYLPILTSPITISENETYFELYIVSNYFDSIVNSARNALKFPKEIDPALLTISSEDICEEEVENMVISVLQEALSEEIEKRRTLSMVTLEKFRATDEGLRYRHVNLTPDFMDKVPDNATDKKLDSLFHEEEYRQSCDTRKKLRKLQERDYSNSEDYQNLLKEYINLSTGSGMSKLAEYVAHRKTVIELFEKYLEWIDQNTEQYEREETLHNLIYTMGGSHNTIEYDKHNLWLLDDRLTFHRYIHSDEKIRNHEPIEGVATSVKEPDLVIYDTPFVYGEKDDYQCVNSVVIFEFKRPNRDLSYTEFFRQKTEQILGIKKGTMKTKNGKNILFKDETPITYYYVCDVNGFKDIEDTAKEEGFRLTPYNSLLRLVDNRHEEIITYQTLLVNARRRNASFFDKLGLL